MPDVHRFTKIEFQRFKAFKQYTVNLRNFNILVGANNSGKSTILAAFRILAAALRRANARQAIPVEGPDGAVLGHSIDLNAISVAEENIFYNYDTSQSAMVTFTLDNGNHLHLYFPHQGSYYLIPDAQGRPTRTPVNFRRNFRCPIGFAPILGPVDHNEPLLQREAARQALYNYRSARNFRNIWYHYPEQFDEFRNLIRETWSGMDVCMPEIDSTIPGRPTLHMFCPEERIPREIFWAGFGFQVWCQMLTHLINAKDMSLFLIDEPDIYLHSELQRQLLSLLKELGPDILIATHSIEMISEAETDELLWIDKSRRQARRLRSPTELTKVFSSLGSNANPILTQIARTRRALFVEGKDFIVLGKFARKVGKPDIANRINFSVVPVGGFSPERIRNLKGGMETALGNQIMAAAILDRDYRSGDQCEYIRQQCTGFCEYIRIHERKEIENLVLVPSAINRAVERRVAERARRTGATGQASFDASGILEAFAEEKKTYITSQFLDSLRHFHRERSSGLSDASITELGLTEFESRWNTQCGRLSLIPGKDALSRINEHSQNAYGVSVTPVAIIDAMTPDEVPQEVVELIGLLETFAAEQP